jgi:hypothetical protein
VTTREPAALQTGFKGRDSASEEKQLEKTQQKHDPVCGLVQKMNKKEHCGAYICTFHRGEHVEYTIS